MKLSEDFRDLLAAFEAEKVEYLLIGGYAVTLHSKPRHTKDVDIWIGPALDNAERAASALEVFGAPGNAIDDLRTCATDEIVWFGNPPGRVDVLKSIPGLAFDEAFSRRVRMTIDGLEFSVISRQDLITAKLAAGRPQDIQDVETLRGT
jgi:predicted nucleotidyltransferase